jgi:hypothetical protein
MKNANIKILAWKCEKGFTLKQFKIFFSSENNFTENFTKNDPEKLNLICIKMDFAYVSVNFFTVFQNFKSSSNQVIYIGYLESQCVVIEGF